MVSFPMDLQGGFTKLHFFLCVWDSRDNTSHYHRKDWLQRSEFSVGNDNVKWESLIEPQKVLMPITAHQVRPHQAIFHCSWQVVSSFQVPQSSFSKAVQVKAGIFVGPQIKKIIECKLLNRMQKMAWNSFVAVVQGFLGNHKAENYAQLVQTLIKNYAKMGCRMSLKVHILDAHLDKFKENMGVYSEEQGEHFHQDLLDFEHRYQ